MQSELLRSFPEHRMPIHNEVESVQIQFGYQI